jgi:MFS family permease
MPSSPTATPAPRRPVSLGVIFLTIFIDLLGFTIIFPLFPAILEYYLRVDGTGGGLGWLLARIDDFSRLVGSHGNYRAVLFGGVLGSLYSFLQFIFSPIWGALSDRLGRRRVLLITVAGTLGSYVLWFFSGSFLLFVLARLVGGGFAGNISVATAAVADVTTRENRAKGMSIIGSSSVRPWAASRPSAT